MFLRFDVINGANVVVDEDFIAPRSVDRYIAKDIIDVYEPRNLNVAANIVLVFIWCSSRYGWDVEGGVAKAVENTKKGCPEFSKYADEVDKYLLLM